MTVAQWMRENRVFSICAFVMNSLLFYKVVEWAISTPELQTVGGGALVAAILSPMAATYKFVLEFAKDRNGEGSS
jgi:hypothetical protein